MKTRKTDSLWCSPQQGSGKPGQTSQLLLPSCRPYPGHPLDGVERPHKKWAAAGDSGQTKHKDHRKEGCLGKGDTLYDGRLWLSQLSYLPSQSFGCGKQRSRVLGVRLLPEECTNNPGSNNPGSKPKALAAAPRGSSPQNASTINRACGVGLAQKEDACNRNATPLLSFVGNTRNSSETGNVDTIHEK